MREEERVIIYVKEFNIAEDRFLKRNPSMKKMPSRLVRVFTHLDMFNDPLISSKQENIIAIMAGIKSDLDVSLVEEHQRWFIDVFIEEDYFRPFILGEINKKIAEKENQLD